MGAVDSNQAPKGGKGAETLLAASYGLSERVLRQKEGRPETALKRETSSRGDRFDFSRVSPLCLSPHGHRAVTVLDPQTGERVHL